MKLTESQIQQLYTFTQKHYVDWYDVQTELVDHLANGIEAQWETNSNFPFEDALQLEFKKFGIFGFTDVIEEKTKVLNKRYRNIVWGYFKDFFKLPKIIMTLFLIWCYYNVLLFDEIRNFILITTIILLTIIPFRHFYLEIKYVKHLQKETSKKWLFDATLLQLGGLSGVFNISAYGSLIYQLQDIPSKTVALVIISTIIVIFSLVLYISIYIVSPQLRKNMAKQHPDYKFV